MNKTALAKNNMTTGLIPIDSLHDSTGGARHCNLITLIYGHVIDAVIVGQLRNDDNACTSFLTCGLDKLVEACVHVVDIIE